MPKEIIIILIAGGLYIFYKASFMWRSRELQSLPDKEFLFAFSSKYPSFDLNEILRERNEVAKYFGLPPNKINVNLKITDLSKICNTIRFNLAINDIIYDLQESGYKKGVGKFEIPETIGDLIYAFLILRSNKG